MPQSPKDSHSNVVNSKAVDAQFQAARVQSKARWLVWLRLNGNDWEILRRQGLTHRREAALRSFLGKAQHQRWLAGAAASGRPRWQECGSLAQELGCLQMHVYPNQPAQAFLLAGMDGLDSAADNLLKLVSLSPPILKAEPGPQAPTIPEAASVVDEDTSPTNTANGHDYTQRQLETLCEALHQTAIEITQDLELDRSLHRLALRTREMINARGAEIGLLERNPATLQNEVRVLASETPWNSAGSSVPLMAGLTAKIISGRTPLAVESYHTWPGRLPSERHILITTAAGAPLFLKGEIIGVLTVMDDCPERQFGSAELEVLVLFAVQAAILIHKAHLYTLLEERLAAQRQAESRLVHATRLAALGETSTQIANDLNNPLTSVIMLIETTLNTLSQDGGAAAEKQRASLEQALGEALRARAVVHRLLNMARGTRPLNEPPRTS